MCKLIIQRLLLTTNFNQTCLFKQVFSKTNINISRSIASLTNNSEGFAGGSIDNKTSTTSRIKLLKTITPNIMEKVCYTGLCDPKSTKRPTVFVTRPDVAPISLEMLEKWCKVEKWNEESPIPRNILLERVRNVDAIYCTLVDKIDKDVLNAAGDNLKVVATISVGLDHIDLEECHSRKIRVGYTPDVLTDATAELTVALMLATGRRLMEANKAVYNGEWAAAGPWSPNFMCGMGIKDSVVGIVGFGRIGQEVAKRIKPFKPKKLQFQNRSARSQAAEEIGIDRVGLEELLETSDYIVLTCALSTDTKALINESTLNLMKPNAILINSARGAVVNQDHLYCALKLNKIRAAGLDVTCPEPLPLDHPLMDLDNIVILPHIGSADMKTRIEMAEITAKNILAALNADEMVAECKPTEE